MQFASFREPGARAAVWVSAMAAICASMLCPGAQAKPPVHAFELAQRVEARPLSGHVVVWSRAPIFDTAGSAAAWKAPAKLDDENVSGATWRVVADHGRAVEVESITAAERARACARWSLPALGSYRLRAFAPRAALLPVASQTTTVLYSDLSEVVIRAGTPLVPGRRPGEVEAQAWAGLRASVRLADDAIGLSFQPDAELPAEGPPAGVLRPGAVVEVNQHPGYTAPSSAGATPTPAYAPSVAGEHLYVTLQEATCLSLTGRIAAADLIQAPAAGRGAGGVASSAGRWRVQIGAKAYWPDGRPAGVATAEVGHLDAPLMKAKRSCWKWRATAQRVGGGKPPSITLCHDPKDVTDTGPPKRMGGAVMSGSGEMLDSD